MTISTNTRAKNTESVVMDSLRLANALKDFQLPQLPRLQIPKILADLLEAKRFPDAISSELELTADVNMIGKKLLSTASLIYKRPIICEFTLTKKKKGSIASTDGKTVFVRQDRLMRCLRHSGGTKEETIAALLGHELGHCVARHNERAQLNRKKREKEIKAIDSKMKEAIYHPLRTLVLSTQKQSLLIQNEYASICESPTNEKEADEIGVLLFVASGYRPESINVVLEFIKTGEAPNEVFITHPPTDKRIHNNRQFCDALVMAAKVTALVLALSLLATTQLKSV